MPNSRRRARSRARAATIRAAPSLRYLSSLPQFSEHTFESDGDEGTDLGPTGGHNWDGRAASAHEQARLPLLSLEEMGGPSVEAVSARLRIAAIKANADPRFFDLGLCGPLRTDLADHPEYCGRFRTPTLRNVALRRSFFHNGVVRALEEAVRFYVQRGADPARRFDDLPVRYQANVNTEPPFGREPALSETEIADVAALLETLTDADQR